MFALIPPPFRTLLKNNPHAVAFAFKVSPVFTFDIASSATTEPAKQARRINQHTRTSYTWTQEQDALILDMRLDGHSWKEIGKELGREHAACHQRYIKALDPSLQQTWTPQKVDLLNQLVAEGKSWRHIADQLLFTQSICRDKWMSVNKDLLQEVKRQKLRERKKPRVVKPQSRISTFQETGLISVKRHRWCDQMDGLLIDLMNRGYSWRHIGSIFGMVPMTCYARYRYRLLPKMRSGWVPCKVDATNTPYYLLPNRARKVPETKSVESGSNATVISESISPSASALESTSATVSASATESIAAPENTTDAVSIPALNESEDFTHDALGVVDEDFSYNIHDDTPSKVWTQEEDDFIIERRQNGDSFKNIGRMLKLDPRICYRRYFSVLDPTLADKQWTPDLTERLQFYVEQGLSWTTISNLLGFHRVVCREKYKEIVRMPSSSRLGSKKGEVSQMPDDVTSNSAGQKEGETPQMSGNAMPTAGPGQLSSYSNAKDDIVGDDEGKEDMEEEEDYDDDEDDDFDADTFYEGDMIEDLQDDDTGNEEEDFDSGDDDDGIMLDTDASGDGERIEDGDLIRRGRRSKQPSMQDVMGWPVSTNWDQDSVLREVQRTWTPEEETVLIQHVLRNGTRGWDNISVALEGRHSAEECRAYWKFLDMPVRRPSKQQDYQWKPHREVLFWRAWLECGSNFNEIADRLNKSPTHIEEDSLDSRYMRRTVLVDPGLCEELFRQRTKHLREVQGDKADEEAFQRDCVEMALSLSKPPEFKWNKERSVKLQKLVRQRLRTRGVQVNWINWKWVARHVGGGATAQRCSVHWRVLRKHDFGQDEWTDEETLLLEKGIREIGTLFNHDETLSPASYNAEADTVNGPTIAGFRAIQRFYIPNRTAEFLQRKYFLLSDKAVQVTLEEYMAIMEAVDKCGENQWDKVLESLLVPSSSRSPRLVGWTKAPCRRVWESSYKYHVLHTHWSPKEDQDLKTSVERIGQGDWHAVCRFFPGKSAWQCQLRWCQLNDPIQPAPSNTTGISSTDPIEPRTGEEAS
ncbi:hypothetical protein BGZ51_005357 [Haplosporangium sp. Z 767]|nr:hypothetical protein BGZ51_005357 [Haplosporangium sp. Z 767]